ncbi:TraR/DksA family transcriptional regulator [Pseudalkalibacillus sp. SCS-8]|uniref:TraR/DksA family transcriptional regulator n=1 Tax=Pseudalkalibacillus nanhaiensis TaxID=3115291 RepID=UPI0032DA71EA
MPLTDKQLEEFKSKLEEMKKDVLKRDKHRDESVDEDESRSLENHMGDAATAEYEHEKELTLKESDEELLDEINQALQRIENGTYGKCVDTGEEISYERLKAVPYAKRTIDAQRKYDKKKVLPDERVEAKREDPSDTIEQIQEEQDAAGR